MSRYLTYANVTATLALFLALTGGVYAATKISGSKIKKESIAGKKLKSDGVTGQQIDESSLGKVPNAQNADNADNATNATTAQTAVTAATAQTAQTATSAQTLAGTPPGGFVSSANVKSFRFDVTVPEGQPTVQRTALALGPLTLTADCDRGNDLFQVKATSSAASAGIDSGYVFTSNNDLNATARNAGGGLGATPLVLAGTGGGTGFRRAVGTIVYNDPATVITIPFALFYNVSDNPAETRCFLSGTATQTAL